MDINVCIAEVFLDEVQPQTTDTDGWSEDETGEAAQLSQWV